MPTNVAVAYEDLDVENRVLVNDSIHMLLQRQMAEQETLQVIQDAREGIGLSEAFDTVQNFMEALNAED